MVMVLFVLGFLTVVGVALWVGRRTVGGGPSHSNRYLGDASSGNEVGFGSHGGDSHHDHGGGWSGGDGGGWSGGDGGGSGGGN
ncbi:hypothetical protein ACIBSW_37200 [Actinoplanes sp. NPDC049668]|uniref:hypothetical protein n=1 Tax=unclassified Actinoplanes TaxID=2626549 RepID=UPI0033B8FD67